MVRADVCRRRWPHRRRERTRNFRREFPPRPHLRLGETAGFLTGYYEPIVDGSRFPTREFPVPIYRRPADCCRRRAIRGSGFPNSGRSLRRDPTASSFPTTTAAKSRMARSMASTSKSAGSGIRSMSCSSRSRVRAHPARGRNHRRASTTMPQRLSLHADRSRPDRPQGSAARRNEHGPHSQWIHAIRIGPRSCAAEPIVRVLSHRRIRRRRGDRCPGLPLTPGRSIAVDKACMSTARRYSSGRLPIENRRSRRVPPVDDRPGHRLGDRRSGTGRPLLGCRQSGRQGGRPSS